jgi:hypothetical protein
MLLALPPNRPQLTPFSALASAVEWELGMRSSAAAAASIATQHAACASASTRGACALNAAMLQQLTSTYLTLVDNTRARWSEHSSILRALLLCQQNLNALARSSPSYPSSSCFHLPLMHSLSLTVQSLRDTIAVYNSCLHQLLSRPTPCSSTASSGDPVLQCLGAGVLLQQLQAAQRAVRDAIAAAAVP